MNNTSIVKKINDLVDMYQCASDNPLYCQEFLLKWSNDLLNEIKMLANCIE